MSYVAREAVGPSRFEATDPAGRRCPGPGQVEREATGQPGGQRGHPAVGGRRHVGQQGQRLIGVGRRPGGHFGRVQRAGLRTQQPEAGLAFVVAAGRGAHPLRIERLPGPRSFKG